MSRSLAATRLRIAELRFKLMGDRSLTRIEEEHLLKEIEELRSQLRGARGGSREPAAEKPDVDDLRKKGAQHAARALPSDRRRHERFDVEVPFRFTVLALPTDERLISAAHAHAKGGKRVDEFTADLAHSRDFSEGGMRFEAEVPIPEGSIVLLEVPSHGKGPKTLRMKAEIVWHRPANEGAWETAARFVGLDRVTREWLTHLRVTFDS